jgi:hypothetical protein
VKRFTHQSIFKSSPTPEQYSAQQQLELLS